MRTLPSRFVVLVGLLALLLAGCGRGADDPSDDEPTGDAAPAAPDDADRADADTERPDPAPDAPDPDAPDPDPGAEPIIADGRHPTYLTGIDVAGRTLTFDVIQFLTGDEAIAAFREDEPEDPDGTPPNDYHIRNVNPLLRTLPVAPDVTVRVVRLLDGAGPGGEPWTFETLPDHLAEGLGVPAGRLAWNPYWLTVVDEVITVVEEQYLP